MRCPVPLTPIPELATGVRVFCSQWIVDHPISLGATGVSHPDTSVEAGAAVRTTLSTIQENVLRLFIAMGPMTDWELTARYWGAFPFDGEHDYAESSVRKRRTELEQYGFLRDSSARLVHPSVNQRSRVLWMLTEHFAGVVERCHV